MEKFILEGRYFTYRKLRHTSRDYPKKQTHIQEVTNIYLTKHSKRRIKEVTEEAAAILSRMLKN